MKAVPDLHFPGHAHLDICVTLPCTTGWHLLLKYVTSQHITDQDFLMCSEAFLLLMHTRACGLGTNLPNVDVVIVHDSDWSHCFDTQNLLRAHSIGGGRPLTLMRLVMRATVEERILQLSQKKPGNAALLKGGPGG